VKKEEGEKKHEVGIIEIEQKRVHDRVFYSLCLSCVIVIYESYSTTVTSAETNNDCNRISQTSNILFIAGNMTHRVLCCEFQTFRAFRSPSTYIFLAGLLAGLSLFFVYRVLREHAADIISVNTLLGIMKGNTTNYYKAV